MCKHVSEKGFVRKCSSVSQMRECSKRVRLVGAIKAMETHTPQRAAVVLFGRTGIISLAELSGYIRACVNVRMGRWA